MVDEHLALTLCDQACYYVLGNFGMSRLRPGMENLCADKTDDSQYRFIDQTRVTAGLHAGSHPPGRRGYRWSCRACREESAIDLRATSGLAIPAVGRGRPNQRFSKEIY